MLCPISPGDRDVFGEAGHVLRVPTGMQPPQLTHTGTREFLADVGIPVITGMPFAFPGPPWRLPPLTASVAAYEVEALGEPPVPLDRLFLLGRAVDNHLTLDGASGAVYLADTLGGTWELVHSDLSSLTYGICLLHKCYARELAAMDDAEVDGDAYVDALEEIAERVERELARVDGAAFEPLNSLWDAILTDVAGGIL
ncbi:SUKH-4 family immunity protein [Streptomyces sp. NPDC003077]|uniref:SUKH-4 family immunity protein n=1 Tax=Streptomyces sp. NPDC003077 TaxID=3154443 RepID=UPI0033BF5CC3